MLHEYGIINRMIKKHFGLICYYVLLLQTCTINHLEGITIIMMIMMMNKLSLFGKVIIFFPEGVLIFQVAYCRLALYRSGSRGGRVRTPHPQLMQIG